MRKAVLVTFEIIYIGGRPEGLPIEAAVVCLELIDGRKKL